MDYFVRLAHRSDTEALRWLESEARTQLAQFRGGERLGSELPLVDRQWSERIGSKEWLVLVGGFDETPLGYLCVRMASAQGVPLIEQVFVTAQARQLGLGDGLVNAAIESCRQQGVTAIDAFALPGDRETKNLFERSGLTARLLIVSKNLGS
ncbi:MAG: GNAT family N-acetyltransferase [Actinomycetota bacterium]